MLVVKISRVENDALNFMRSFEDTDLGCAFSYPHYAGTLNSGIGLERQVVSQLANWPYYKIV